MERPFVLYDFFEVEGKDISDFNLADKINLYFKIGNYVDIDFTLEESLHLEKVKRCETFEDVLDVAEDLYKYCKGEMEEDIKEQIAEAEAEDQDGMDMEGSGRPDLGEDDSEYDDEEEVGSRATDRVLFVAREVGEEWVGARRETTMCRDTK